MEGWLRPFVDRWPELSGDEAPPTTTLQRWLDEAGQPWKLVTSARLGRTYEESIANGELPTRPASWHDVFNVLAFVRFPRAKRALHGRVLERQRARLARAQRSRRESEEDALTLLDEAVVLVVGASEELARIRPARHAGDMDALDEELPRCAVRFVCFGHALLEHLHFARPTIGAGALEVDLGGDPNLTYARVDERLAGMIERGALARPCFSPTLPWPDPRTDRWWRSDLY